MRKHRIAALTSTRNTPLLEFCTRPMKEHRRLALLARELADMLHREPPNRSRLRVGCALCTHCYHHSLQMLAETSPIHSKKPLDPPEHQEVALVICITRVPCGLMHSSRVKPIYSQSVVSTWLTGSASPNNLALLLRMQLSSYTQGRLWSASGSISETPLRSAPLSPIGD